MKVTVFFEQEDYDGRLIKLSNNFRSLEEAKEWMREKEISAQKIGKSFVVRSIKIENLLGDAQ